MAKAKDKTIFHERLKLLLEESGHNQVWLAKTLGFSTPSVNGWTQDSEPSFSTLCKIAELFDVTTDYLLGITESKSTNYSLRACAQITGLSDIAIENLKVLADQINESYWNFFQTEHLITARVSRETSILFTTNAILENRRLLEMLYEYFSIEEEKNSGGIFRNMKSNAIILEIQNELRIMRDELYPVIHESLENNIHQITN